MESAIVALVCIALMVFAAQVVSEGALSTTNESVEAWNVMHAAMHYTAQTRIAGVSGETPDGVTVDVVFGNTGETKIEDYDMWDVFLTYQDTGSNLWTTRMAYESAGAGSLDDNEWAVEGVYRDESAGEAEGWDPLILNPDEEIKIRMQVNPTVKSGSPALATVSTPAGVTASVTFER